MEKTFSNVEPHAYVERHGVLHRVSWGAIFAGVVVALVIQLVLTLLGIGIGLGTINPATSNSPFSGLGTGAAVWLGITMLLALFAGGWATAKLAGTVRGLTGVLHSVVMWGLVTLASFFFMTSAIGSLLSGTAGIIGKSVSLVAEGAAAVAPQASEKVQQALQERGINVDSMMAEVQQMLRETGKPELQPENLQQKAENAQQEVQSQWPAQSAASGTGAQTPEALDQQVRQALQKLFATGKQTVDAADKEAAVNVLMARTNMTRTDAERTVDGWVTKYQQVAQSAENAKNQALHTTENAMNTLSKVGIWMFVLMLFEALAAAFGGWLGASTESVHRNVVRSARV